VNIAFQKKEKGGVTMRRDLIIVILTTFLLTVALFTVIPILSQSAGEYDPWLDINDDGKIDMKDVGSVARAFGATGDATVKAAIEYDSGWIDITHKSG